MKKPIVIWGMGQMGGVFAHALLREGHAVFPVTRASDPTDVARAVPEPLLCLVAVGENDLETVLPKLPPGWRARVGLLQNELLPHVWMAHGIEDPTVAVVWFEKKKNVPITPVTSTAVAGPEAETLVRALRGLDIPAHAVPRAALRAELVKKNLYILTANVAGLVVDSTVQELLDAHGALVTELAEDALAIQAHLGGEPLDRDTLLAGLFEAFRADPEHRARGRSAEARLARALSVADAAKLAVPAMRRVAARGA
jgi:ketopantoate reductase